MTPEVRHVFALTTSGRALHMVVDDLVRDTDIIDRKAVCGQVPHRPRGGRKTRQRARGATK